ncbi:hypothetical protein AAF712_002553 [Marasmius tenuissimus]|uniref:Uncharacterized protein n=1 Tax=Marasmius tenuissimus TaxID=585030 RepID=A0ABR3A9I6_9AGAR
MRSRRPLLFIFQVFFERSTSLVIKAPTQAKLNEVITVTWTYQVGNPTHFAIAGVPTPSTPDKDNILLFEPAGAPSQQTGIMTGKITNDKWYDTMLLLGILLTSKIRKTLTVGAYDIGNLTLVDVGRYLLQDRIPKAFYTLPSPITIGETHGSSSSTATRSETPDIHTAPASSTSSHTLQSPAEHFTPASVTRSPSSTDSSGDRDMNGGPDGQTVSVSGSISDQTGTILGSSTQNPQQLGQPPGASNEPPMNPTGTPSQTRKSDIGTILGVLLGLLALTLMILFAIFYYRRRNKNRQDDSRKLSERPITFFKDKMIHRLDDQSQTEEKNLPGHWDSDREWLPPSFFVAHSIDQKDTDGMSLTDSLTTDLPLSTAYAYTITEYESDITSTIAGGLSEVSNNAKGGVYGAGARTDRQMEIEGKIFELQREILGMRAAGGDPTDVAKLGDRIERLRQLQGGKWAMELSDEVPSEIVH